MDLRPGDYFVVRTDSLLARLIIAVQNFWAKDGGSCFNHAGIIIDSEGNTFESLKHIDHYHISRYYGCPIMIVRYKEMTPERCAKGYAKVLEYDGMIYPWWRLPLHLLNIARFFKATFPVCSELVGLHKYYAGVSACDGWGWNPDDLADNWRINKYVDIIYEGQL